MNLEELKRQLEKEADIYNHKLTDSELQNILITINSVPKADRTKTKWQEIIKEETGCIFRLNEGLDFSDINSVHQEILQLLRKNGNS